MTDQYARRPWPAIAVLVQLSLIACLLTAVSWYSLFRWIAFGIGPAGMIILPVGAVVLLGSFVFPFMAFDMARTTLAWLGFTWARQPSYIRFEMNRGAWIGSLCAILVGIIIVVACFVQPAGDAFLSLAVSAMGGLSVTTGIFGLIWSRFHSAQRQN